MYLEDCRDAKIHGPLFKGDHAVAAFSIIRASAWADAPEAALANAWSQNAEHLQQNQRPASKVVEHQSAGHAVERCVVERVEWGVEVMLEHLGLAAEAGAGIVDQYALPFIPSTPAAR